MTLKGAGLVALLTLVLAGLGWKSWQDGKALEAKIAQQAAITKAAERRADSLAKAVQAADEQAARDSVAAAVARAQAANQAAAARALAAENRALRAHLTLLTDTTVIVDSGVALPIPAAVGRQLASDDSVITALRGALLSDSAALAAQVRLAGDYKAARDSAEAEVAALRTANAALHQQVKLLQPPKCGKVCGGVIGAGAVILISAGIRRL